MVQFMMVVIPIAVMAMMSLVNGKRDPDFYPQHTMLPNEHNRRMQYFRAGYNRASEYGINCDARPYGFTAKPITDQYGSNNYLSCIKNPHDPKLGLDPTPAFFNKTFHYSPDNVFEDGSRMSYEYPVNVANKLSTQFYDRKMNPISNPHREEYLEMITDLIGHKKPFSVVGYVPNPKNSNGHCLNNSKNNDYYTFYDF